MKIRNGFVSNSSSTSFIVAIPKNMEITEEDREKLSNNIYFKKENKDSINRFLTEAFEKVKIGEVIYQYNESEGYYWLSVLAKNRRIILCDVNSGPEDGFIVNAMSPENVPILRKALEEKDEN